MDGYKHYIRVDANNIVIHAFSDAFEQPQDGDILVESDAGRHYNLQLMNERGQYIYKVVNGQMVARTQTELDTEWAARPTPPPSQDDRIKALEDALLQMMLGG